MPSEKNITQVDYAILGLLAQSEMTGYEVRMVFEKTAMGSFSSSPGAIYPALKRLQKHKLVAKKKDPDRRVDPLIITASGRKELRDWVLRPVTHDDVKSSLEMLVLRVAFLDSTDNEKKRKEFFASMIKALKEQIAELEQYHKAASKDMPLGGRLTFEYGMESYRSTLAWIQKVQRAYASKK